MFQAAYTIVGVSQTKRKKLIFLYFEGIFD